MDRQKKTRKLTSSVQKQTTRFGTKPISRPSPLRNSERAISTVADTITDDSVSELEKLSLSSTARINALLTQSPVPTIPQGEHVEEESSTISVDEHLWTAVNQLIAVSKPGKKDYQKIIFYKQIILNLLQNHQANLFASQDGETAVFLLLKNYYDDTAKDELGKLINQSNYSDHFNHAILLSSVCMQVNKNHWPEQTEIGLDYSQTVGTDARLTVSIENCDNLADARLKVQKLEQVLHHHYGIPFRSAKDNLPIKFETSPENEQITATLYFEPTDFLRVNHNSPDLSTLTRVTPVLPQINFNSQVVEGEEPEESFHFESEMIEGEEPEDDEQEASEKNEQSDDVKPQTLNNHLI